MDTIIFTKIGMIIVFLFAGIGIATFTIWAISKFLTYAMRILKVWKLFIDFIFDYKQFKQWKNDRNRNS